MDYFDQYPGLTYLEAAPEDVGVYTKTWKWCDKTDHIPATEDWIASAVGRGQANTDAMLAVCAWGAATGAADYVSPNGADDWFLPSIGELMLMYTNLRQAGVGGFEYTNYWSSSAAFERFSQSFRDGNQTDSRSDSLLHVRPVRAF